MLLRVLRAHRLQVVANALRQTTALFDLTLCQTDLASGVQPVHVVDLSHVDERPLCVLELVHPLLRRALLNPRHCRHSRDGLVARELRNVDAADDVPLLCGGAHRHRDEVARAVDLAQLLEEVRLAHDGADDIEALDDVRAEVAHKGKASGGPHAHTRVPRELARALLELRVDGGDDTGGGNSVRGQMIATGVERDGKVIPRKVLENAARGVDGTLDDVHDVRVHPHKGTRADALRCRVEVVQVQDEHSHATLREPCVGVEGLARASRCRRHRRVDRVLIGRRHAPTAHRRAAGLDLRLGPHICLFLFFVFVLVDARQDVLRNKAFDVAQLITEALVRNLHVADLCQGARLNVVRFVQRRAD
eukprot:PhM_4_TR1426/c0_g1_i1/m.66705